MITVKAKDNSMSCTLSVEERLLYLEQRMMHQVNRFERLLDRMEKANVSVISMPHPLQPHPSVSFFDFMHLVIASLRDTQQERTAEAYESTMASFRRFLNNTSIGIDDINAELIKQYESYLWRSGLSKNTSSFYMRILRAVFNRAIDNELTLPRNPFKHVYTGIDRTVKRALPLRAIKRIKNLPLDDSKGCDFARDMFMLSFYLRGMSYIDMAYLRRSNLSKGYLTYKRRKTGQELYIKWEACMQQIVDKYKDKCCGGYLLPIIKHKNESRSQLKYGLTRINRYLGDVARKARISIPLTLYVARHSWASVAKDKKIPLSVISESMGHGSEKTTRIYLKSLDKSVIDRANRQILGML